jgi:hypothetical protein
MTAANATDAEGKFNSLSHHSRVYLVCSLVCLLCLVWFNATPVHQVKVHRHSDFTQRPLRSPRFENSPQEMHAPKHPHP